MSFGREAGGASTATGGGGGGASAGATAGETGVAYGPRRPYGVSEAGDFRVFVFLVQAVLNL